MLVRGSLREFVKLTEIWLAQGKKHRSIDYYLISVLEIKEIVTLPWFKNTTRFHWSNHAIFDYPGHILIKIFIDTCTITWNVHEINL